MENILSPTNVQRNSGTRSAQALRPVPDRARCNEHASRTSGAVLRPVDWFKKHPVYIELQLAVAPAQLASLRSLGELAFKDPLLVTRHGVIIDGYARKEYADRLGIAALLCVELDIDEEEALRAILNKHRRSSGWNDYNRIRMASRLKDVLRALARANQQAGGRFKGSSNLTEANVRKEIADAAGVCEGNVTKVDQLSNSDPEVLKALAGGEIRIHRAWLWRRLTPDEQREELRLYKLNRDLKLRVKAKALGHQGNELSGVRWVASSKVNTERILRKLSPITSLDSALLETIMIGVLNIPGKAVLLSTELFEELGESESTN